MPMNSIEDRLQGLIDRPPAPSLVASHAAGRLATVVLSDAIEEIERLREFEFMYQSVSD
jgi:hypothetical protein